MQTEDLKDLSDEELRFLLRNLDKFTPEEAEELMTIAEIIGDRRDAAKCRDDLIEIGRAHV